ncbi:hypothetical protein BGX27_010224 [Mortierella sp. AM989]|nr:hypothetical protein BGX27_010224 [Mortierella sp. AM989]
MREINLAKLCHGIPWVQDTLSSSSVLKSIKSSVLRAQHVLEDKSPWIRTRLQYFQRYWANAHSMFDNTKGHLANESKVKLRYWIVKSKYKESRIYAKTPFQSTINEHQMSSLRDGCGKTEANIIDDKLCKRNSLSLTEDHIIDGVDMRYLGQLKDIAVHFEDRLSNNQPSRPKLKSIKFEQPYIVRKIGATNFEKRTQTAST